MCASVRARDSDETLFEKVCFNLRNLVNSNLKPNARCRLASRDAGRTFLRWGAFFFSFESSRWSVPPLVQLVGTSNLVDPASSHTLVSKIKPCMSKYKRLYTVKLRMAHYISYSLFDRPYYLDNRSNSRANTCVKSRLSWKGCIY